MNGELFLTSYTILSQAAIGLVIMMFIGSLFAGDRMDIKRYHKAFLTAVILSMAAMGISALHLGSPLKAMNSLGNLGSSWLSREILLTNLFFVAAAWGAYVTKKGASPKLPLAAGALLGLICVLCQAAIYANTVFLAWSFGHAYITFFATTFVLGSFLATYFLFSGDRSVTEPHGGKVLLLYTGVAFIALVFSAGFYSIFAGLLSEAGASGQQSLELLSSYNVLLVFCWVCSAVAIIGLGMSAYKKVIHSNIVLLLLLAIIGEGLHRFVFYCIGVNNGL